MRASRWITLGAAAIGAAVVGSQLWPPAATAPAAALQPAESARSEPVTDFARLLRRDALAEPAGRAPFAPTSWQQPRAASPKAAVVPVATMPAPATVPQFPYRYAGRVELGRALHQAYFMRSNGELVSVLPGQVIDGLWRIERLTGEHVDVTYIPLAASFALALADLTAERGGSAPPGPAPAQIASSSEQRSPTEGRPLFRERASVAGGSARESAPAVFGGPAMAPAFAGRAAGAQVPVPGATVAPGRLGSEVPTSGSMPGSGNAERGGLTVADAAARGIAGGAIPQGRLGDATPSGKLGVD
jgi:hypothetical protein